MNRLRTSKSPYLLEHADNPVDWYPWSEEAFHRAREADRPVFLSVGYSACHWCHVMARESFEDHEVAELLNRYYVSIKVDREERPDVDAVYQQACSVLAGGGGWPLTVIMTPDRKPFFAGTYLPKTARYGRPGLLDVLREIARRWAGDRSALLDIAEDAARLVRREALPGLEGHEASRDAASEDLAHIAFQELEASFDERHGAFGGAPKFPMPASLYFLLRYHRATGSDRARSIVEHTLMAMRRGGIYDQVGFGFHRYSTDRQWLVPHFEKMLYDNALLALAYLEAHQSTGRALYARVAREIFAYMLRDMRAPDGGFASSQDADSDGREGAFYTWTPAEVRAALGEEDAALFCRYFGISAEGNFEDGRSVPNLLGEEALELVLGADSDPDSSSSSGAERDSDSRPGRQPGEAKVDAAPPDQSDGAVQGRLRRLLEARERVFQARSARTPPKRDDKVLTAWNGLAIAALARTGRVLGDTSLIRAATETAGFLLSRLRRPDGRLLARYREGEALFPAYLDDYAFLIWGLIELWETTFEPSHLEQAVELTRAQITLFRDDRGHGGFFFTGKDAEELLAHVKEARDGALPSGNSVSAHNLLRLGALTGDGSFIEEARALFRAFSRDARTHPSGHPHLLSAWLLSDAPLTEIVIAGPWDRRDTKRLWDAVRSEFLPEAVLLHNPGGDTEQGRRLHRLIPALAGKEPLDGRALAYVCKDFTCHAPMADPAELKEVVRSHKP